MKLRAKAMIKIAIINHSFQKPFYRNRWEQFANQYPDCELFLITPKEYKWGDSKALTFGIEEIIKTSNFNNRNFHLVTVRAKKCATSGWRSPDFKKTLKTIQPDFIYHIGTHTQEPVFQIAKLKHKFFKQSTLLSFSMRGTNTNIKSRIELMKYDHNFIHKILRIPMFLSDKHHLNIFNKYVDCVLCHYPDAKDLFIKEGFKKTISIQTQVGVDTNIFKPNENYRREIRNKYDLNDCFVFGSASRFHYSKGIKEILNALTFEGKWKYLLIGSGTEEEIKTIKDQIIEEHLEEKVIMTGYVPIEDMPKYWNAVDCAIHFPLSTPKWIETFSLALVQAMATKKAVIGSTSGSVPYQIGPNGILVNEGDSLLLSQKMAEIMNDKDLQQFNSELMFDRAKNNFSIISLNKQFYALIMELKNEKH